MNTVLKYPGSKWSMTDWIIGNFPPGYEDMTYCEPYFGSGAVFFNKKRSTIETVYDDEIGGEVMMSFGEDKVSAYIEISSDIVYNVIAVNETIQAALNFKEV